ncbi:FadR/GntR family transcriptional regulator [Streptosporangium sp. DT93]|uniref:FadR/GntR family transcriptional regulator n=1 Tax=Streptosporangium sp. DT93 TaxID=3393428 RepID=UPI003CF62620
MRITDIAIERLRELIVSGVFPPGARLPPETELAQQLGISRGSMREAVRALTHAQMLSVRRGDGTYVTDLQPEELLRGIGFAAQLARNDTVLDVIEVRRLLEPAATALAALRMSDEALDTLRTHLEAMRRTADDPESFVEHDAAFHNCIAESTGNMWLAAVLRGLADPTIRSRRLRVASQEDVSQLTLRQHEDIFTALLEHDPALAEATALAHVHSTQRGLRAILDESAEPARPHP